MPRMMPLSDAALADLRGPLTAFVRDDDAGWDDPGLLRLLDVMHRAEVPIDLAVIPTALGALLAQELRLRMAQMPGLLGVHQHGHSHLNHETEGRKCEFGGSRALEVQREDLSDGLGMLRSAFGSQLDAIFTPPWNRCDGATPALLAELGYTALSRDRSAPRQDALPELAVDVDWTRHYRAGGVPALDAATATAISRCASGQGPLGLMLHHAVMTPDEHTLLAHWLQDLQTLGRLTWCRMPALRPPFSAQGPSR